MPALTDSRVLTRIKSQAVQCPVPSILVELRDTLSDFYQQTKLNRVKLTSVPTVALQESYALPIPLGFYFVQAHNVRVNAIQIDEMSEDDLDLKWNEIAGAFTFSSRRDYSFGGLDDPTWRTATGTQPRAYYFEPDGSIRLVAIPDTIYTGDRGILATVSLKPDRDTVQTIDDGHWQDHADEIVAGTLTRLFAKANKPWTDFKLAAFWGSQYQDGVATTAGEVRRSDIRNDREIYHAKVYA